MQVNVHLHGILRDCLPLDAKGRVTLMLHEGTTVHDVVALLGTERRVAVSVNGALELETACVLHDGDDIAIFTVLGGG